MQISKENYDLQMMRETWVNSPSYFLQYMAC